jgi:prepilin-type N-terminal cleavage/methylation domain-containing protein
MLFKTENKKRGFTFVEMMIVMSLFILLASIGMGAYFQYYSLSLMNADIDNTITLIRNTRFKALKNPTNDNYGIHINPVTKTITEFRDTYNVMSTENINVELEQLKVLNLNLNPNIGVTDEILFESQTGKTQNYGNFIIGEDDFSYTITINSQGVIE